MRKLSFLFLLTFFTPILLSAQKGPLKVADEKELDISTAHPYNPQGEEGVVFEKRFARKNASYIKFRFENFQLEGDDHLEVLSPETGQRFLYAGGGKIIDKQGNTISDFWSLMIRDDEAVVRLHSDGPASSYGFDISKVAYGYPQDSIESIVYESVCGTDDKQDLECHSSTTMFSKAQAVCRLYINGSGLCTGWLLGDQGHVMTNNHCISTSSDAQNTEFQFNYRNQNCGSGPTTSMDVVSNSSTLICTDADLDYTLLQLPTNPTSTYGYLSFRNPGPLTGERIYIPQHPNGDPKKISVNDDNSSTGYGKIQNASGTNGAGLPTKVEYYTDTDGGSSGSPVIAYNDHNVVALHNTGGCLNGGNRTDSILSDMGSCLPSGAIDTVVIARFSSGAYKSCDGTVSLTDRSLNSDSLVWYFGDGDTSHATNPVHTYSGTGTYTIQQKAYRSQGGVDSMSKDVLVEQVSAPSTTNDTICSGGVATLKASGSGGDILWYDDTSASPIDTGTSFKTGAIPVDSTFYVRQNEGGISDQKVGPVDNSFHSGKYFTANDNWGCVFDVKKPMVLESVKVFSDLAANRTIELVHNNSVVKSITTFIPSGKSRVDLNFNIPVGSGYLLKVTGSTVNLYRNDGGANYPYEVPGLVSITGNNTGSAPDYYYYFYDWEVHEQRCKSAYEPVQAVIDSNLIDAVDVTDVQTCDGSDGELTVQASNGNTPYEFALDGGSFQTSNSFSGLAPDNYDVIVMDSTGCDDTSSVVVDPLPSPVIDSIDTTAISSCGAGDGGFQVNASSGNPPYEYSKDSGNTFQNTNGFSGLSSGTYQVVVKDDSGCTASGSVGLAAPSQPWIDSVSVTNVSCYGDSNGVIDVHASNANEYSIDDGVNYQNGQLFTDLAPGNYSIKVRNSTSCKDSLQVTVDEPPMLSLNGGSSPDSAGSCEGSAWVDISGGTPNYDIQWDVQGAANNDSLDSLCSGTYTVVVTDSNGCKDSIDVEVGRLSGIADRSSDHSWKLHPVPATDRVTLESPTGSKGKAATITFFNMLGKKVFEERLELDQGSHVLDLKGLAEGVYILDIRTQSGRHQYKLPLTRR